MTDVRWKVLVVDDEPFNLQLMRQLLTDRYQLSFANNGFKALELANKICPDLILLDIMMPDMDGYEVCRKLKATAETAAIPVIFVTAKTEIDDETRGLELGAIDYITKPISPSVARARIKNHLELKLAREIIEKKSQKLEAQNRELTEAARLREDVEHITRHDLKAPLNAIISFPRIMLMDQTLPAAHREYVAMIEEAGLMMLDMINLSLDLFKMERGIYELQPVAVDLAQVIKKVINSLSPAITGKKLSLTLLVDGHTARPDDRFPARGEELLCYSMLANLIKNAIEASPPGAAVAIRLYQENDWRVINIHNQGAVPENIRDSFFNKYVTSGKASGTGLGTYSAKLIAETQQGRISYTTSAEQGTVVAIHMPPMTGTGQR